LYTRGPPLNPLPQRGKWILALSEEGAGIKNFPNRQGELDSCLHKQCCVGSNPPPPLSGVEKDSSPLRGGGRILFTPRWGRYLIRRLGPPPVIFYAGWPPAPQKGEGLDSSLHNIVCADWNLTPPPPTLGKTRGRTGKGKDPTLSYLHPWMGARKGRILPNSVLPRAGKGKTMTLPPPLGGGRKSLVADPAMRARILAEALFLGFSSFLSTRAPKNGPGPSGRPTFFEGRFGMKTRKSPKNGASAPAPF